MEIGLQCAKCHKESETLLLLAPPGKQFTKDEIAEHFLQLYGWHMGDTADDTFCPDCWKAQQSSK